MLVVADSKKVILIDLSEGKFEQIDEFIYKNEHEKDKKNRSTQNQNFMQEKNDSKVGPGEKNIRSSQRGILNTSKIG